MESGQIKKYRIYFLLVLLASAFTFLYRLGFMPLEGFDESRLAVSALEMMQNKNYWIVTFNNKPDLWSVKPPLMIWCQALSFKIFGVNEFATRFPSAIAGVATVLIVFNFVANHFKKLNLALLTSFVLISTPGYFGKHVVRSGDYDSLLVLFLFLQFVCFYRYIKKRENRSLWLLALFVFLAVFTKSIAGLFFIPGFLVFVLIKRNWKIFLNPQLYFAILAVLASIAAYYFYRENLTPGYLEKVWENELGGRFNIAQEENTGPFWFYLQTMIQFQFSYWMWFLLIFITPKFRKSLGEQKEIIQLLGIVSITFFIIISTAATKLQWYLAPIYPLFSILVGLGFFWIAHQMIRFFTENKWGGKKIVEIVVFVFLILVPIGMLVDGIHLAPNAKKAHNELSFGEFSRMLEKHSSYGIMIEGYDAHVDFHIKREIYYGKNVFRVTQKNKFPVGMKVAVGRKSLLNFINQNFYSKPLLTSKNYQLLQILGPKSE